ncbi:type IV-A pilus assembly ATPase PilB, partial [Vibrio parahaemolyticus EKP-028]
RNRKTQTRHHKL